MSDNREILKSVLHNLINGEEDTAAASMHDYFVAKTKELTGIQTAAATDAEIEDLADDIDGEDLDDASSESGASLEDETQTAE